YALYVREPCRRRRQRVARGRYVNTEREEGGHAAGRRHRRRPRQCSAARTIKRHGDLSGEGGRQVPQPIERPHLHRRAEALAAGDRARLRAEYELGGRAPRDIEPAALRGARSALGEPITASRLVAVQVNEGDDG